MAGGSMSILIKGGATAALVYRAWSRKSLTSAGIFAAFLTAVVHSAHPWIAPFALLCVFFLTGTSVTKVKHDVKAKLTQSSTGASGGEGPRNHVQVFANSLVASVLILLHTWQIVKDGTYHDERSCWHRPGDVLVVGIVANYAAVAADTFSSELGILSKSKPRLITALWRVVPPGTNGGVTLTGLGAGILGAACIAVTSTVLLPFCREWSLSEKATYTLAMTLAGLSGTLLDSLLGALFQASVIDIRTGKIVEGEGGRKVLVHGSHFNLKETAKLRSQIISYEEGKDAVAKSSAIDVDDSIKTARKLQQAGASGTEVADRQHESRKVAVGKDILDNNAVNLLMAALVSVDTSLFVAELTQTPSAIRTLVPSNQQPIMSSLRFIPPKPHPTYLTPETSAPSAPGVHDTLRSRLGLSTTPIPTSSSSSTSKTPAPQLQLQSTHPLEARLAQWRTQQDALKMEMLRRQFGIAEPVRRGMELKIAREGEWRPQVLGGPSNVHSDILAGRDAEIGWEDVFVGNENREVPDFHTEMEARKRMNW
ncbi:UMP1-domain-containing protein [Westerdykella ornata]|uniref:UMP1-domain-containing protein n=1 Tax=Westerdykella ornata TaxID=318751 RepID=A0A6A6JTD9_WESOR|nr:UMP1-domain-containing protein [Westerdykella ornata]KAF2279627.1 UMP1-domain-containing protein [Westerdykella ornata]